MKISDGFHLDFCQHREVKSRFSFDRGLWVGVILLTLTLIGLQNTEKHKIRFIEFLDRQYLAFEQSLYRGRLQPSKDVEILSIDYHNDIEFWFDEKTRKDLTEKVLLHKGPIVASLDPLRLQKDPYLSNLLKMPNFIRPFVSSSASLDESSSSQTIEQEAAHAITQGPADLYGKSLKLVPTDLSYYKDAPGGFGALQFSQDTSTQFIYEFPQVIRASQNRVPSLLLDTVRLKNSCKSYQYDYVQGLLHLKKCKAKDITIKLPHPTPLFFYKNNFNKTSIKKFKPSTKLLIIDITDPTKSVQTFTSERTTWATIFATAFSNVQEGHLWITPQYSRYLEFLLFLIGLGILFYASHRLKPLGVITTCFMVCLGYIVIDLLLPYRESPVEEFLSLTLIALVAFVTRTVKDFEERSLIERAFSGYVSPTRLRRLLTGKEELNFKGRTAHLTTLMIDISRFSTLSEQLATEEVFQILQGVFSKIDPLIFEYNGYIDKKMGDGMLCFFGDQLDENTNPQKAAVDAIHAALVIQKLHLKIMDKEIKFRIGINSGPLLIGNTGSQQHFNYTVLGDAVNFTQRLETACPVDRVLIGEETALLVDTEFELQPIEIEVKHLNETVTAYLVQG